MKWLLISAACLYTAGIAFFAAFAVAHERMFRNFPVVEGDPNQIYWMFRVSLLCFGVGTQLLVAAAAKKIVSFFK